MSTLHKPDTYDGLIELAFDIAKTSGQITFLGLLDRADASGNTLVGLFDWTCQACGAVSQDTVALKPQEEFLAKWPCRSCSRVTLVRFRARAGAEWIAQHTLAVTGNALRIPAEGEPCTAPPENRRKDLHKHDRQTLLWLAVPVLVTIILLGVLDIRRISRSGASFLWNIGRRSSESTPSGRLVGCWVNQTGDHVVYFGPVDPVSRRGMYIVVSRSNRQARTVQFKILQEKTEGEQLMIREESGGLSNGLEVTADPDFTPSDATLYVPVHRRSMTHVDIRNGKPVMTMYHNAELLDGR